MKQIKINFLHAVSTLRELTWNIKNFLIRKWNEQEEDNYFI